MLLVQNIDERTRRVDVEHEFERAGKVRNSSRIRHDGMLIEMAHRDDAKWAYKNIDRTRMDGTEWRVHWANEDDFADFDWKWFED